MIDAEDERKRAQRKLKAAKEAEASAFGRPVTSSAASGSGKPSKADERTKREEERKAGEDAKQRRQAVDNQKEQTRENKQQRERDDEAAGRKLTTDDRPANKKKETPEQKDARVAKEKAQQAYSRANKAEAKEEQRAISKATKENGNVRPAVVPETPEWKKAKRATEDARNKVDEANKKYDEVNAEVNKAQGGKGDGSQGKYKKKDGQGNANTGENSSQGQERNTGESTKPKEKRNDEQQGKEGKGEGGLSNWGWTPKTLLPCLLLLPFLALLLRGYSTPANIVVPAQGGGAIFSNPTSPAPKWVVNSPQPRSSSGESAKIHINNLQGHGPGGPNIVDGSSQSIVVEESSPVYQEHVGVHFSGPTDPSRVGGMLFGAGVVLLPIFLDSIADFSIRQFTEPIYIQDLLHWLLLVILCVFLLWKVNLEAGLSRRYGPRAVTLASQIQSRVAPIVVTTAEGNENPIWAAEDLIFGNGKYLLGMIIAAAGPVGLPMRTAFIEGPGEELSTPMVQLLSMMGLTVVGMLLANA